MDKVSLNELNMKSRDDVILFLKKLWNEEETNCPICDNKLELLHNKAKKSNTKWQCKNCDKIYNTIDLLDELNITRRWK